MEFSTETLRATAEQFTALIMAELQGVETVSTGLWEGEVAYVIQAWYAVLSRPLTAPASAQVGPPQVARLTRSESLARKLPPWRAVV